MRLKGGVIILSKVYSNCLVTALILLFLSIGLHSAFKSGDEHIKIGFIFVGDEMTPYTDNFVKAKEHVEEVYGDKVECIVKYNVVEEMVDGPLQELVDEKCDLIITASYGYGTAVKAMAALHPEIQFVAATCDDANTEPILSNYHNCMGEIYQGRYICGVVAGMKLQEMLRMGIISPEEAKIGYVAAFPYAEVISGYTAFFLGVRSVVPEATMMVKYVDTWSSYTQEKKAAIELIEQGCVIISQHSDTTGPAVACENAGGNVPVYHVGYNQSMTEIAPTRSLVSCAVDYSAYFEQSVGAVLKGERIEDKVNANVTLQDSYAGIDKGWVKILDINEAIVAQGTADMVNELYAGFKVGEIQVFKGDYTGTNPFDPDDTIDLKTEFRENDNSSSPQFHYVLDEIIMVLE